MTGHVSLEGLFRQLYPSYREQKSASQLVLKSELLFLSVVRLVTLSYKIDSDWWHGRQLFFSWSSTVTNEYIKTVFKYLYWECVCSNGYKLYPCLHLCSVMWGALACVAYTWTSTETKSTFGLESKIFGHNPGFPILYAKSTGGSSSDSHMTF